MIVSEWCAIFNVKIQ